MSRAPQQATPIRGLSVRYEPCAGPETCVYHARGGKHPSPLKGHQAPAKPHPIYVVEFRRDVRRYRETFVDGTTREDASRRAGELLAAFDRGELEPKRVQSEAERVAGVQRKTIGEVCEWYLRWAEIERPRTLENRRVHCDVFRAHFGGHRRIDVLDAPAVRAFRTAYQEPEGKRRRSNATVNRALATLWHMLRKAADEGWIDAGRVHEIVRVGKLEEAGTRERFLSDDEEARLLDALPADLLDLVRLGLVTGMRQSEIRCLRWSEVDFAAQAIRLERQRTKQKAAQTIPLTPDAEALLSARRRAVVTDAERTGTEPGPYVFPSPTGEPWTKDSVSHRFRDYADKAGLGTEDGRLRFRFHDLRHTVGTRLTAADVPLGVVAQVLGHSSVTTTMRYAHAADAVKREALNKLPRVRIVAGESAGDGVAKAALRSVG